MTLAQIAGLGKKLVVFLGLFADCFSRRQSRMLARVYVQGQLSGVQRKTAEGIALEFGTAPRTLQRFLESSKWDEERFHDRCQQTIAKDHAHPEAIGVADESGTAKSGKHTVGVGRQWNGNRGKVDNCVVGDRLTIEQVRSAMITWLASTDLKPAARRQRREKNENKQRYYQRRNRQAGKSHTKTKTARLLALGIDVNCIKSCKT